MWGGIFTFSNGRREREQYSYMKLISIRIHDSGGRILAILPISRAHRYEAARTLAVRRGNYVEDKERPSRSPSSVTILVYLVLRAHENRRADYQTFVYGVPARTGSVWH